MFSPTKLADEISAKTFLQLTNVPIVYHDICLMVPVLLALSPPKHN